MNKCLPPYDWTLSKGGSDAAFITFRPNGVIDTVSTFTYCDDRGTDKARGLDINATGRPAIISTSLTYSSSCNWGRLGMNPLWKGIIYPAALPFAAEPNGFGVSRILCLLKVTVTL